MPEENSLKLFNISLPIVLFFLWEGQGCLRNKYGFQIGNAMDKNKLYFDQEETGIAMEKK